MPGYLIFLSRNLLKFSHMMKMIHGKQANTIFQTYKTCAVSLISPKIQIFAKKYGINI